MNIIIAIGYQSLQVVLFFVDLNYRQSSLIIIIFINLFKYLYVN